MMLALASTYRLMYIDQIYIPNAIFICVIVFNAAFGFRYVAFLQS